MEALLVFNDVSFSYAVGEKTPIPAIKHVSLKIEEGEMVAVVGANGSGKSTFSRLASALLLPQTGSIKIVGLDTRKSGQRARIHAGVGVVFQYPEDQIVGTTVEEDVAFGPENLGLPPAEVRERVEDALREVSLWEQRERPPHMLSAGQTQRLALAGVLAMRPRCILFDEASTMLDPGGRRDLMETMLRLNREGLTIIYVTHFMDEAARAGRIIVFNGGQVALDDTPAGVFSSAEQVAALGLELPPVVQAANRLRPFFPTLPHDLFTFHALEAALPAAPLAGEALGAELAAAEVVTAANQIEVSHLGYVYLKGTPLAHRALADASLVVKEGQAHGLLGRTGSGKSTLIQHLNALLRPQEGRVRVGAFDLNDPAVIRKDVVRQVGLVFQNPEAQFFEYYVGDEVAFGPRQLQMTEPLAERVRWAMELAGLDFGKYKDRPLFALSGGERRKVALASTLALKPSILLLDEPTAGLDPRSRLDLIGKLADMESAGGVPSTERIALVLSSHQMEDLVALTGALTVFDRGRDVMTGSTAQIFEQEEELREHGLVPPLAVRLASALRKKGWPIPQGVMSLDGVVGSFPERSAP